MYLLTGDSAIRETSAGEVQLSVRNSTRRDSDDKGGLPAFIFLYVPISHPRGPSTYGEKAKTALESPIPPPSITFQVSYVFSGCSNAQPSAAHASGTLLVVTRRFPSFQEYWDENSACTSSWQGKNGGREGRRRLARGSCDVGSNQMIR